MVIARYEFSRRERRVQEFSRRLRVCDRLQALQYEHPHSALSYRPHIPEATIPLHEKRVVGGRHGHNEILIAADHIPFSVHFYARRRATIKRSAHFQYQRRDQIYRVTYSGLVSIIAVNNEPMVVRQGRYDRPTSDQRDFIIPLTKLDIMTCPAPGHLLYRSLRQFGYADLKKFQIEGPSLVPRPTLPIERLNLPDNHETLDDESFVDRVHQAIDRTRSAHGEELLSEPEQNMLDVYQVFGVVENDGFEAFFALEFETDVRDRVRQSLLIVGARKISELYAKARVAIEKDPNADSDETSDYLEQLDTAANEIGLDPFPLLRAYLLKAYPWA